MTLFQYRQKSMKAEFHFIFMFEFFFSWMESSEDVVYNILPKTRLWDSYLGELIELIRDRGFNGYGASATYALFSRLIDLQCFLGSQYLHSTHSASSLSTLFLNTLNILEGWEYGCLLWKKSRIRWTLLPKAPWSKGVGFFGRCDYWIFSSSRRNISWFWLEIQKKIDWKCVWAKMTKIRTAILNTVVMSSIY